jgi:predicted CXXCH cytochrome family protein
MWAFLLFPDTSAAEEPATGGIGSQTEPVPYPSPDSTCLLCHSETDGEVMFASGEGLPVQIKAMDLDQSVHGSQAAEPLICTDCHSPVNDYGQPHAAVEASSLRAYQVERAESCQQCHVAAHPSAHPGEESDSPVICTDCHGGHGVDSAGSFESREGTAVCVDCHTAFNVETTDAEVLVTLIQVGFFRDETRDSGYCLGCHEQPGMLLTFANGDTKSLTINPDAFDHSVHGADNPWQPLECISCHEGSDYPHEPIKATSLREYSLERYLVCQQCHDHNYDLALDSVHGEAIENGNEQAAVCTDCHSTHDTPPPAEPRERISHTCEQCHSTIFMEYATSVHGDALLSESNPDVPTCIECHGVHNINHPTTALARVRSPKLCAGCHANVELMANYEISTDVFATYVADFHGTTVALFEHQDPTAETNKAVCYDCHGVHNIRQPDDPEAGIKSNLLAVCQQCHPDATADFSDAWTSHFRPSLDHNQLVYLVNLFYQLVIPATVSFFGFLVLTDIYRRVRTRLGPAGQSRAGPR